MDITPKTKKAMSKDEVSLLVDLIQSNPMITAKETNAATNKLKEECWASLTNAFNFLIDPLSGQIPRQKEQLKLKWDNLKKSARKRAENIRLNNLKSGGEKDEILDKVTAVLGSTCSGFDVPFGGDAVGGDVIEISSEDPRVNIVNDSPLLPSTMKKRKIGFRPQARASAERGFKQGKKYINGMTSMSKVLQSKAKMLKGNQDDGRLERNLAIANYYNKKAEKLDLEIKILKESAIRELE